MSSLVVAVVVIALLGLISGLGELFGSLFKTGILGDLSNLIGTLSQLVDLLMIPIAGIVGAFTLSSIGTTLTASALKTIGVTTAHVLGGILGAVCGGLSLAISMLCLAAVFFMGPW